MKRWIAAVSAMAAVLVIWFFLSNRRTAPPAESPEKVAAEDAAVAGALAGQDPNTVTIIASNFARVSPAVPDSGYRKASSIPTPAGEPAPLQFTNFAAATVLENMGRAIRQYGQMYGGNPVGTNPEITSQLNGNNPKHIDFINAEAGMRIDQDGELVDPWGTPYFFHQLSGTDMEIHSAGPDRILWTADDLVNH